MEKFNANGQKIYIDPDWISGKTCVFMIDNMSDRTYTLRELLKMRNEFVKKLEAEGFIITKDPYDTDENIIYFTMNSISLGQGKEATAIYKRNLDKKVAEVGGKKFNFPYTLTLEQYFQSPFFPAVLKK
ncbi:MAG: hypothetical protein IJA94_03910 [Bacilli bacterium]|nr:hypothetical protein [Bacilli bacterium]